MARPLRIEFAGAVYHVMGRGNQGQSIWRDDGDRKMWLATLGAACERTGWRIHAWVLMGNHYHLLLETPEPNLVCGMKWLQGTYTQRYNARHHQRGHLFQGRYRAVPVEASKPIYFQTVSTYIHLNPARAKLIEIGQERLWAYPWSSYPSYVRGEWPGWLERERVMASVGLRPEERTGYQAWMESRVLELGINAGRKELEARWQSLRRGWYVGGEGFRAGLLARSKGEIMRGRRETHGVEERRAHDEAAARMLLSRGLRKLGLRAGELAGLPKGRTEKQVLAWWLRGRTSVSRRWVAQALAMGYETRVSQAVSWVENCREAGVMEMKRKLQQTR